MAFSTSQPLDGTVSDMAGARVLINYEQISSSMKLEFKERHASKC